MANSITCLLILVRESSLQSLQQAPLTLLCCPDNYMGYPYTVHVTRPLSPGHIGVPFLRPNDFLYAPCLSGTPYKRLEIRALNSTLNY